MKFSKALAVLSALSIATTAFMASPVQAEKKDVNVALGKFAKSSVYGDGSWDGGDTAAERLVDGDGSGIYVSAIPAGSSDVITVDLAGDYTVHTIQIDTYGNDDPTDPFYMSDSTFVIKAKKSLDDAGVEIAHRKNGESNFFKNPGGGYYQYFDCTTGEKYRYIELTYTEGTAVAADLRMPELQVFAPADEATNEAAKQIKKVSVGKSATAGVDPTWGSYAGLTDNNVSTNFYAYGRVDGQAWVTIDLGATYPITLVNPQMQVGGVSDIIVSNTASFDEEAYLDENGDGTWSLEEEDADGKYRYVKIIPTVAISSATDSNLSTSYKEITVYTDFAEDTALTNIEDKVVKASTNGNDQFWPVAQLFDGNKSTAAGLYACGSDAYIQGWLGDAYLIKKINMTVANEWGCGGTGKIKAIWLSNDPDFTEYEAMVKSTSTTAKQYADEVDYLNEWVYDGDNSYKYVRIFGTPADLCYAQYSSSKQGINCFIASEAEIMATASSAKNQVVSTGKYTSTTGGWYGDLTGDKLTDGNEYEICAGTGLAAIKLDYPMCISQVEISLRPYMTDSDTDRRYDVYLSNSTSTDGALQLMSSASPAPAIMQDTIVLKANTDKKYKYVLVGSSSGNFWTMGEAKVLSSDTIDSSEITYAFGANAFAQGESETYTINYRSTSATTKTIQAMVACFTDGRFVGVGLGDKVAINGNDATASATYTFGEDATINNSTFLKGFVWEDTTMAPFYKGRIENK